MIEERKIKDFIIELRMKALRYESLKKGGEKLHWLGSTILTDKEMRTMCSNFFEKDYELMTPAEQRKFRRRIFDTFKEDD